MGSIIYNLHFKQGILQCHGAVRCVGNMLQRNNVMVAGNERNSNLLLCPTEQLVEFVGPVAIYGDVNDILETSMARMKEFVETTDLEQLQASRKAEREEAEREQEERKKKFYEEHGSGATWIQAVAHAAAAETVDLACVAVPCLQKLAREEELALHVATPCCRCRCCWCGMSHSHHTIYLGSHLVH